MDISISPIFTQFHGFVRCQAKPSKAPNLFLIFLSVWFRLEVSEAQISIIRVLSNCVLARSGIGQILSLIASLQHLRGFAGDDRHTQPPAWCSAISFRLISLLCFSF